MINYPSLRMKSRGFNKDYPVQIESLIFGPGEYLTPEFQTKYNITHVINCAQEEFSPTWFKTMFPNNYICLNAYDTYTVNILDWYPTFKETITEWQKLSECKNIYIHCHAGMNRSGFLFLAYFCFEKLYDYEDTELYIIKKRPCALLNMKFRDDIIKKVNQL